MTGALPRLDHAPGEWLDRIVAHGLGARSRAELALTGRGPRRASAPARLDFFGSRPRAARGPARQGHRGQGRSPRAACWSSPGSTASTRSTPASAPTTRPSTATGPRPLTPDVDRRAHDGRSHDDPNASQENARTSTASRTRPGGRPDLPRRAYGAVGETFGEAVFSTGMTGYQETLTDPSYHRQVVVMTAPHVGNTGVNDEDPESQRIWVSGLRRARPRARARPTGARRGPSTTSCATRASSASAASTPAR